MKPDDLDALEELARGATALPWESIRKPVKKLGTANFASVRSLTNLNPRGYPRKIAAVGDPYHDEQGNADAAYITGACNAVPALIARIRELERSSSTIKQELREHITRLDTAAERIKETQQNIRRS